MIRRVLAVLVLCAIPAGGVTAATPALTGPLHVDMAYGQSEARGDSSSAKNTCLGSALTPAGTGQIDTTQVQQPPYNYMLGTPWGAPAIGGDTSFQPSQVNTLLSFQECGPYSLPTEERANQTLGVSVDYLEKLDALHGRGATMRGYFEAGINGASVTSLSPSVNGESCSATGTGPQCYCYAGAGTGTDGTNGATCIFPFDQAFIGEIPTSTSSMLGALCHQASQALQPCSLDFVTWHQGDGDQITPPATYEGLLTTLVGDICNAARTLTRQKACPKFLIEPTKANPDGSCNCGPAIGQIQYVEANRGAVHLIRPQYVGRAIDGTVIRLSGKAVPGDSEGVTFTSAGLTGSPRTVTTTVIGGDTLATVALRLAANINADADLFPAGVYAIATGSAVEVWESGDLQPAFSLAVTNGASISATFLYPQSSSHETNIYKVAKAEAIAFCEDIVLQGATDCPELATTSTSTAGPVITLAYGFGESTLLTPPLVSDTTTLPPFTQTYCTDTCAPGHLTTVNTYGYEFGTGMTRAFMASAPGSDKIVFGGEHLPSYGANGQYVYDLDNPTAIPPGTIIKNIPPGGDHVNINNQVAFPGIAMGDRIVFSTCNQAISSVSVDATRVRITLDIANHTGWPAGCTLQYAMWGPGEIGTVGSPDSAGNHQLTGFYGAWGNIRDSYRFVGPYSGHTYYTFAVPQQWSF